MIKKLLDLRTKQKLPLEAFEDSLKRGKEVKNPLKYFFMGRERGRNFFQQTFSIKSFHVNETSSFSQIFWQIEQTSSYFYRIKISTCKLSTILRTNGGIFGLQSITYPICTVHVRHTGSEVVRGTIHCLHPFTSFSWKKKHYCIN